MIDILHRPVLHSIGAHPNCDMDLCGIFRFSHLNLRAKPVNNLIDNLLIRKKTDCLLGICIHIGQTGGKFLIIHSLLVSRNVSQWGCFSICNLDTGDPVQSVEYHIAPVFTICHQVVPLIVEDHLIGTYILMRRPVQLFIQSEFIVIVMDLFALLNGGINDIDIVKEGLVLCFAPVAH